MRAPKWLRILAVLVVSCVVWGTIGFIMGGWSDAITLGIVAGLAFTAIASYSILRAGRPSPENDGKPPSDGA